jgi:putative tryptophan/tyrosine transport system substrate-binding protein
MWPARRFPAILLVALALSLLVALVAALAQPRAKPARIAVLELTPGPPASARPSVVAFQQHLRTLGWVEGQNLTIEWRWAEGSLDRFATLVEEIVRLPVEVLVVPTLITAELAQKATTTIPIVIVGAGSLGNTAPSLAPPGGNITGFAGLGPELWTKRLELLTQVVPGLTRVAVIRGLFPSRLELEAMEVEARALGVQLQRLQARDPTEIDQAVAAAVREGAGALMVGVGGGGPSFPTEPNSPSWPSHTGCRRSCLGGSLSRRVGS